MGTSGVKDLSFVICQFSFVIFRFPNLTYDKSPMPNDKSQPHPVRPDAFPSRAWTFVSFVSFVVPPTRFEPKPESPSERGPNPYVCVRALCLRFLRAFVSP
jgi:hypothetical protein